MAAALCGALPCAHAQSDAATPITIVSSDLRNFYRAVDQSVGQDSAARVATFLDVYIRQGSPGLQDWALLRLADWGDFLPTLKVQGWDMPRLEKAYKAAPSDTARIALFRVLAPLMQRSAAQRIAGAVAARPRFYSSIRDRMLTLDTSTVLRRQAARGLEWLRAMYPEGASALKPVYLLVGRLTSGGTVGPSGMLLGAEMSSKSARTPVGELTPDERSMVANRSAAEFAALIVHEAVHTLQPRTEDNGLLSAALKEGTADFLASLALPEGGVANSGHQRYGRAHESRIWREFRRGMATNEDAGHWMYNYAGAVTHGAPDLGYFVGFRIAEAYYSRAADKRAAIRALIRLEEPRAILRASGYEGRPVAR